MSGGPGVQVIRHGPGTEVAPLLVSSQGACLRHPCGNKRRRCLGGFFGGFNAVLTTGGGGPALHGTPPSLSSPVPRRVLDLSLYGLTPPPGAWGGMLHLRAMGQSTRTHNVWLPPHNLNHRGGHTKTWCWALGYYTRTVSRDGGRKGEDVWIEGVVRSVCACGTPPQRTQEWLVWAEHALRGLSREVRRGREGGREGGIAPPPSICPQPRRSVRCSNTAGLMMGAPHHCKALCGFPCPSLQRSNCSCKRLHVCVFLQIRLRILRATCSPFVCAYVQCAGCPCPVAMSVTLNGHHFVSIRGRSLCLCLWMDGRCSGPTVWILHHVSRACPFGAPARAIECREESRDSCRGFESRDSLTAAPLGIVLHRPGDAPDCHPRARAVLRRPPSPVADRTGLRHICIM